jgi:hypothetical protein
VFHVIIGVKFEISSLPAAPQAYHRPGLRTVENHQFTSTRKANHAATSNPIVDRDREACHNKGDKMTTRLLCIVSVCAEV